MQVSLASAVVGKRLLSIPLAPRLARWECWRSPSSFG
jgi:hypothetical protein